MNFGVPLFRRAGWAGALAAAMLVAATTLALPARAAGTSALPVLQAFTAMYNASSFQIAFKSTETLGKTSASKSSGTMIFVRHGKGFDTYLKMTTQETILGKVNTNISEMVLTATKTCFRLHQTSAWQCQKGSGAAMLSGITPDDLRKAYSQLKQVTAIGTSTVNGQQCNGYRATIADEPQTIWISASTGRPVRVAFSTGQSQDTEDFSNWNDSSLKIPAV